MARKRKSTPTVQRVIKLTLDPARDADLIEQIDTAPNKARLVENALRGHRPAAQAKEVKPKVRDQLVAFLS
jgi:hypothetical protein